MNTPPNPDKYGIIGIDIKRHLIESFNHIPVLDLLNEIKENALKYEGKLALLISGYDNDERDII